MADSCDLQIALYMRIVEREKKQKKIKKDKKSLTSFNVRDII